MKERTVLEIVELYNQCIDELDDDIGVGESFKLINEIVSEFKEEGVYSVMSIVYKNENPHCGICFVTDFRPGDILFQSQKNLPPKIKLIFPDETEDFLKRYQPYLMP